MPKKKFIDKKNAITFHLVHRSQQDPLTADETAPQRVLLPVAQTKTKKNVEEHHKYGIFYDDDYNYLQHLKESNKIVEWVPIETKKNDKSKDAPADTSKSNETETTLKLPSSVFASTVEEDVGMLNKAAPSGLRLDLDPDVVAAMDEDFDYDDPDNELEDNFMELANAECSEEEYDEDDEYEGRSDFSSEFDDEEMDEVGSLHSGLFSFKDEETKSRFTDYSMSSSVIRRNAQLTLLDDRFEQMFSKYDDTELGPLDCDEITGFIPENSDILLQYAAEFEKDQQREKLDKSNILIRQQEESESDDNDEELVNMEVKSKPKWDCESKISTYSNLYNHPKTIQEPKSNKIKLNSRGIPINESNRLTAKALSKLDDSTQSKSIKSTGAHSIISTLSTLSIRPKGESAEERRDRKKQLKDYRRERRLEKKANSDAFKTEAKRQVKIEINNRNNVQGNRIL